MYRIWFERELPIEYAHLLTGGATAIGATGGARDILESLPDAEAIIAGGRMRYNGDLMDLAPKLCVIARTGIGFDNICISDATQRGIAVCNAPDGPTISTAEHAVALICATARQLKRCQAAMKRGAEIDFFNEYDGLELQGLRLGLVGLGRIGCRVARVALALEMDVLAYDPILLGNRTDRKPSGVQVATSLAELLSSSDIISLHLPLTPETRWLIDVEQLVLMKPGAILINTARGELVNQKALLDALDGGHLRAAGLDVFSPEPPSPEEPLLHRENVVATPHIGGVTVASRERLWRSAISQALEVLRGDRPRHLLNHEVWPRQTPAKMG